MKKLRNSGNRIITRFSEKILNQSHYTGQILYKKSIFYLIKHFHFMQSYFYLIYILCVYKRWNKYFAHTEIKMNTDAKRIGFITGNIDIYLFSEYKWIYIKKITYFVNLLYISVTTVQRDLWFINIKKIYINIYHIYVSTFKNVITSEFYSSDSTRFEFKMFRK